LSGIVEYQTSDRCLSERGTKALEQGAPLWPLAGEAQPMVSH